MSTQTEPQKTRQQRRQEELRKRAAAQRRAANIKQLTTPTLWGVFALVLIGLIVGIVVHNLDSSANAANSAYPPVAGISCDGGEHSDFHIHAHLTIYLDGKATTPPAGVGIASDSSCIYWLHTHNTDGIIHIEAPKGAAFTLNNFLNIWSSHFQALGYPSQLNSKTGWQVYVDGTPFTGDFHTIPLQAHTLITLAYNSPGIHPDTTINWNGQ